MKTLFRGFVSVALAIILTQTIFSATYTVNITTDSNDGTCDASCSFRDAITVANSTPDNDIIEFNSTMLGKTPPIINVTLGEIVITNNGTLTINGPGANSLIIDGNLIGRILSIIQATVTINDLTFTRGTGVGALNTGRGGAIYNAGGVTVINNSIITNNTAANGGGLNNASTGAPAVPGDLTLNNCIVSNNTSPGSGGGMQNFSTSTITINNSTFMGNVSNGTTGGGGGQLNGGVRITNSTFVNNSAPSGSGGGIQSNGTLGTILTNVTFSGNSSVNNGGGIHRGTTNVNFFIRNSIVAGNNGTASSPDITNSAAGLDSEGNNIIGNVGTSTGWEMSDLLNTDPMLLPLADNGGFGMTFMPNTGSPAIEGGQNCVLDITCATNNPPAAVTTDQRGVSRPSGTNVDIGAVEVVAMPSLATVSGRVITPNGNGLHNVPVVMNQSMTVGGGFPRVAFTNLFGYFTFNDVSTGQTYSLDVSSKQFAFDPLQVQVNADVTGIIITSTGANVRGGK